MRLETTYRFDELGVRVGDRSIGFFTGTAEIEGEMDAWERADKVNWISVEDQEGNAFHLSARSDEPIAQVLFALLAGAILEDVGAQDHFAAALAEYRSAA